MFWRNLQLSSTGYKNLPRWWVQQVLLKCCHISNTLQGVTFQKTVVWCIKRKFFFIFGSLAIYIFYARPKKWVGAEFHCLYITKFYKNINIHVKFSPSPSHPHSYTYTQLMSILQPDASCLRAGHERFNAESDYVHCSCSNIILIPQHLFNPSKCNIQWFIHYKPKLLILFFITTVTQSSSCLLNDKS